MNAFSNQKLVCGGEDVKDLSCREGLFHGKDGIIVEGNISKLIFAPLDSHEVDATACHQQVLIGNHGANVGDLTDARHLRRAGDVL